MEFFHPSFTRHGARDLKDIKRGNQLKSSKRQEMEELNEGADDNGSSSSGQSGTHKRMRIDYSIFRTDVARLQQNLDDLENDLKQHSQQVPAPLRPHLQPPLVPPSPYPYGFISPNRSHAPKMALPLKATNTAATSGVSLIIPRATIGVRLRGSNFRPAAWPLPPLTGSNCPPAAHQAPTAHTLPFSRCC